jgi:hypothetical protein
MITCGIGYKEISLSGELEGDLLVDKDAGCANCLPHSVEDEGRPTPLRHEHDVLVGKHPLTAVEVLLLQAHPQTHPHVLLRPPAALN